MEERGKQEGKNCRLKQRTNSPNKKKFFFFLKFLNHCNVKTEKLQKRNKKKK